MDDLTLLVTMGLKENYVRFKPYIKDYAVSKDVWEILDVLGKYYDSYPSVAAVKWPDVQGFYFMVKGKTKPDRAIIIRTIFQNVSDREIKLGTDKHGSDLQKDLVAHYVKKDFATKILNKSLEISTDTGTDGIEVIDELVKAYQKEVGRVITRSDLFVVPHLSTVVHAVSGTGYEWRLEELNKSLGSLRTGDLIVIGARPERGKTTLLASEASFFATQLPSDERPIIWVNNEERDSKVMFRIMQAHFGVTKEELEKDLKGYEERYTKEIGNKILLLSDNSGINSVRQLDSLFTEYKPSIILFDQLDKVYGFGKESEREDLRLGKLYQWAREKAREYGPVITASQVDGTGEGEQWITMAQLRGTKTDKQGEADAIITIGSSNDPKLTNNRYIHVPKNKLYGGPRSKEEFRHGYFEVAIKPEVARYVSSIRK